MRCFRLMLVTLLLVYLSTFMSSAAAEDEANQLTIERIFADPSLSGPSPRALKIAPGGDGRVRDGHEVHGQPSEGVAASKRLQGAGPKGPAP